MAKKGLGVCGCFWPGGGWRGGGFMPGWREDWMGGVDGGNEGCPLVRESNGGKEGVVTLYITFA